MTPDPPLPLAGEALAFWHRHVPRLTAAEVLKPADLDAFAVLALVWGKLYQLAPVAPGEANYREMIQLVNLTKQFQALARQFGLLPRERKQAKMDVDPPPKKDEFDL